MGKEHGLGLTKRHLVAMVVLAVFVLLTRLPFVDAGLGCEGDSSALYMSGKRISQTGHYTRSRQPGYPVVEYAYSLLWRGGSLGLNISSAVLSAIAVVLFAAYLIHIGMKDYILASLGMALTPVVYICSVTAVDHIWAFTFVLASLCFIGYRRPLLAGLLLGVAVGCRPASAMMVPPFAIMLIWGRGPGARRDVRSAIVFAIGTLLASVAAFVPVILSVGVNYGMPTPGDSVTMSLLHTVPWLLGPIGLAGMVASIVLGLRRTDKADSSLTRPVRTSDLAGWAIAIVVNLAFYLRYPYKVAYLMPALPFLILILSRFLPRRPLRLACIAMMMSSFLLGVVYLPEPQPGSRPILLAKTRTGYAELRVLGPIFADREIRHLVMERSDQIIAALRRIRGRGILVLGHRFQMTCASVGALRYRGIEFVPLLTLERARYLQSKGVRIYYIPEANNISKVYNQPDLRSIGAVEITSTD